MTILGEMKRLLVRLRNRDVLRHMHVIVARRPVTLAVQTCDACNASCVFCARPKIKATGTVMAPELFQKICDEYAALGGGHLGFSPLMADPLVDPLFMERIALLAGRYPTITPNVFTNAIAFADFSDGDITRLLESVHHIDISIGGFDRDCYLAMYGRDCFDTVWEQLGRLSRLNGGRKALKLHVRTHAKEAQLDAPRLAELRGMGFLCNDVVDTFSDWGGLVTEKDLPEGARIARVDNSRHRTPCFAPMFNMMVMQDGKVLACGCMDATQRFELGDANRESLAELWTSQRMDELRSSFKRGAMPKLCKTCAYYRPYRDYYCNKGLRNYRTSEDFWSSLR